MPKIRYFWLRDARRNPVACVGSMEESGVVTFALAIHNPKDKFNKVAAKRIVEQRLGSTKPAPYRSVVATGEGINPKLEIMKDICLERHGKGVYPQRVRDAACWWIRNYKLNPPEKAPNVIVLHITPENVGTVFGQLMTGRSLP